VILWDTGPLLATVDRSDRHHAASVALMRATRRPLLVPAPVLVEVCYFLQERVGPRAEAAFLRSISAGHLSLVHPEPADIDRAADLVEQYASFPLGTVDASVLAIAERLEITQIASIDHRHFYAVKLRHCDGLELLPG
jgi:uncharacterized protein